jgi:hypothetical protein
MKMNKAPGTVTMLRKTNFAHASLVARSGADKTEKDADAPERDGEHQQRERRGAHRGAASPCERREENRNGRGDDEERKNNVHR